ncbi:MAG: DMT family transporter [Ferrovibrio sp.]|uniref:DMT family transporter n=1 Tax=Ferrovibrio sp. TaxID=1917215 RepID=UPI00262A0A17|nr:DMT family transporter [Ferrovibrio sp.]MCW0233310.1 DMT family transporter [Ferrovibrio sp.]
MLLICAIWGGNFVVTKLAVNHFPPILFTALRFALVAVLMLPWLRWKPGQMRNVVIAAFCMGTLHFALIIVGIAKADDVSVVAVVTQLGVPISTLMAVLLLGERVRWKRSLGIGLAFIGAVVISFDPKVMNYQVAIGLILMAVIIFSLGQITVRRIHDVHTFTMQAWVGILSAPCLLLISLMIEDRHVEQTLSASTWHWGAIIYAAVAVSLIGHGGAYYLLRRYPISIVNPGFTLAPIFGVLAGVFFLNEQLSGRVIIGSAITLLGVLIVAMREGTVADARGTPPEKVALEKGAGE